MLRSLLVFVMLCCCFCACAVNAENARKATDEGSSGLVFGEKHAFWINAPEGWILDNKSGVNQGLHAVFYPAGSSWRESLSVMYANAYVKTEEAGTLQHMIDNDTTHYLDSEPDIIITDAKPLVTADKKEAVVKYFYGQNYEAVAYIDEDFVVSFLVLSSRNEKEFKESLPAFEELVSSYSFFTDKVNMNKKE